MISLGLGDLTPRKWAKDKASPPAKRTSQVQDFELVKQKNQKFLGIDEAIEMLAAIRKDIVDTNEYIESITSTVETRIAEKIKVSSAAVLEEIRPEIETSARNASQRLEMLLFEKVSAVSEESREGLATLELDLQDGVKEAAERAAAQEKVNTTLRDEIAQVRDAFPAANAALKTGFESSLEEERQLRSRSHADLMTKLLELTTGVEHALRLDISRLDGQIKEMDNKSQEERKRLEKQAEQKSQQLAVTIENAREQAEQMVNQTSKGWKNALGIFSAAKRARFQNLEGEVRQLRRELQGVSTRRVEWLIENPQSLREDVVSAVSSYATSSDGESQLQAEQSHGGNSWRSPPVSIAGVNGISLEFQVFRKASRPPPGAEESLGDCTLCMHAPEGCYLVFRLSIGSVNMQFQQQFDATTQSSFKCSADLETNIDPKDGALRVGVEILEVSLQAKFQREHFSDKPQEAILLEDVGKEECKTPFRESLVLHQYQSHRTLELVETEVHKMRSMLVRQIEWRIENASTLRQVFPEGEALCSQSFSAGGIDGLQLLFYPSGHAGVREGFCSYFLYCPEGATLRCWLTAGKQRRDARAVVGGAGGGLFGRTSFCRYVECVEGGSDTLTLSLEVEEAQQAVREALVHQTPAGRLTEELSKQLHADASAEDLHLAKVDGGSHFDLLPTPRPHSKQGPSLGNEWAAPQAYARSTMDKLRVQGKIQRLETQQLPSIWTSVPHCNVADKLEGFHTFRDMKFSARRPGSTPRTQLPLHPPQSHCTSSASLSTAAVPVAPPPRGAPGAASRPTTTGGGGRPRYGMYAA